MISSEEVISALRGRKSKAEFEIMKYAVDETLKIFDEMKNFIKPGKSELEIAASVKELTQKLGYSNTYSLANEVK